MELIQIRKKVEVSPVSVPKILYPSERIIVADGAIWILSALRFKLVG
ncbi:MAG: hypothetical protein IPQ05_12280 [Leptospiraceae bacterium]|nr:hypothetical protein [Leptospiraceae bacterium]